MFVLRGNLFVRQNDLIQTVAGHTQIDDFEARIETFELCGPVQPVAAFGDLD